MNGAKSRGVRLKRYIFVLLLLFPAFAAADSKTEKLERLAELMGLVGQWESQITSIKIMHEAKAEKLAKDLLSQLSADIAYQKKFEQAALRLSEKVNQLVKLETLLGNWTQNFGAEVSEEEVDQLLSFYNSIIGQKGIIATHTAAAKLNEYYVQEEQKLMTEYTNDVMKLVEECNCFNLE